MRSFRPASGRLPKTGATRNRDRLGSRVGARFFILGLTFARVLLGVVGGCGGGGGGGSVTVHGALQPPADAHRHWAFQPVAAVRPPKVENSRWPQTEVDRFILAALEARHLPPAPPADARTLIRRMTFDLLGLPPTPEEVDAFVVAATRDRPTAVGALVDRLLASPHYGERWGRHWLDLARYSDTKGYVYGREERRFVHAPAYRDWVVQAFNQDLPYDRFLRLQLAADQLAPEGSPDLAAMGFLTGGRRFLGVTHDIIDDRIDVVTRGLLGLTVACARCHDHKYDPIPTRDYYSLYGVFHGADEKLIPLAATHDPVLQQRLETLAKTSRLRCAEASARLRARVGDYLAAQLELQNYPEEEFGQILTPDDLIPYSVRRWRDYFLQSPSGTRELFEPWRRLYALRELSGSEFAAAAPSALAEALAVPGLNPRVAAAFQHPVTDVRDAATRYGELFRAVEAEVKALSAPAGAAPQISGLPDPAAEALRRFLYDPEGPTSVPDSGIVNTESAYPLGVTEELWKLQGEVDRRLLELGASAALVLAERKPEPNPRVFIRGRAAQLGDEVPRQFLEILSGKQRTPFRFGTGRRELAEEIASPRNPLTARVMVNRIWQHHFGTGLVKTPSDFGLRAEPPSHPELLDWLAERFVADGWRMKSLHRLILTSAAYQQVSRPVDAADWARRLEADPENRWLSRFPLRRLDFEPLRDAMLAVGEGLDPAVGGRPVELLDVQNHRRTLYSQVDRQFLPGTFRTFDFANPDLHVAVRHETTIPQQALFFLNGTLAARCAQDLHRRFADRPGAERIQALYRALFQRAATPAEIQAGLEYIAAAEATANPPTTPVQPRAWKYGVGEYDEAARRLQHFTALPVFTGTAWQGAETLPGGDTGWAQLTAEGGHPGNTHRHACVRRWTAPRSALVRVSGTLRHEPEPGDGVRAFVVSSRHGELQRARVHHGSAPLTTSEIQVEAGDTLDFVVDIGGTLAYDQFLWSPVVEAVGGPVDGKAPGNSPMERWEARTQFAGPPPAPGLSPWEQYAQVLLLANEFAFVD